MDIDFIKWMCDKADGFEIEQDCVSACPLKMPGGTRTSIDLRSDYVRLERYPLLLQRAIEGVNKESIIIDGYLLDINCSDITVYHTETLDRKIYEHVNSSTDKAKESALKYIYEQEKNK